MMFVVFVGSVGYSIMIGVTNALLLRFFPSKGWNSASFNDGTPQAVAAVFWPITLPAVLAYKATRLAIDRMDARRAAAREKAEELKCRIAELDEELRVARTELDRTASAVLNDSDRVTQ